MYLGRYLGDPLGTFLSGDSKHLNLYANSCGETRASERPHLRLGNLPDSRQDGECDGESQRPTGPGKESDPRMLRPDGMGSACSPISCDPKKKKDWPSYSGARCFWRRRALALLHWVAE